MNIVTPYARILPAFADEINGGFSFAKSDGISLLRRIEWCGRISHRSEDAQTQDSWDRFLRAVVLGHGDWSIVEHASLSVDMLVDRGITHEQVRHRLFGYTQESTRFVNYEKRINGELKNPPGFVYPDGGEPEDIDEDWREAVEFMELKYQKLIAKGWKPQKARSILPNALASRIIITGNLRNWRYAALMRSTQETHPQFRQVMLPLLAEFQEKIPILFEDIVPMDRQANAIKKGR